MVHCGYDPSGALGTNYKPGDNWKMLKYQFGPRPPPFRPGRNVKALNGYSIGKGHLAEAKAAINPGLPGTKPASRNQRGGGACGNGQTPPAQELPARTRPQQDD
jgi:hypothetical protein